MSFQDTYAEEVLHSRRTRAQRAGFWAKVVSFMLMITVAATLRSEPELRRALMTAGTDAVMHVTGQSAPKPAEPTTSGVDAGTAQLNELLRDMSAKMGQMPIPTADQAAEDGPDRIRINRPGTHNGPRFVQVNTGDAPAGRDAATHKPTPDMQAVMEEIGRLTGQIGNLD